MVTVAGGTGPLTGLAADNASLYFVETVGNLASIKKVAKSGGTVSTLISAQPSIARVAVDGVSVYWTDFTSGAVLTLATGLAEPLAIAVDASRVYWIERYAVRSSAKGVPSQFSPPVITSSTFASGMVGVFFNYVTMAINSPTNYAAVGLPFGLTIDPVSGVITGTPTTGGDYSVMLTAKNAGGTDTKILNISIGNEATRIISLSGDFA